MRAISRLFCALMLMVMSQLLAAAPGDRTTGSKDRPTRVILNLTASPATSQAFSWRSAVNTGDAQVQIVKAPTGPIDPDLAKIALATSVPLTLDEGKTVFHFNAVITGLKPDTLYAYRVGNGDTFSEWNHFHTAGNGFDRYSFVYLGDPQNAILEHCSRVFRTAFQHAPNARFWLIAGDLVNKGDTDSLWGELFDALGWIPRVTPLVAVAGNHDYYTGSGENRRDDVLTPLWRPHLTQPENGPEGLEETCFTLVYQNVRFIVLNGNEQLADQARWIEEILRKNTCRWTIVSMHQPCYPGISGRDIPELRKVLVPLYDRYGVDLVLQGHDHTYARTHVLKAGKPVQKNQQGTVYVISVTGPKMYDPSSEDEPIMAKRGHNVQLFQVIDVEADRLTYSAYTVTGELFDRFVLKKK